MSFVLQSPVQAPAQTLKITKVKEHIGAIVTGIDLAQPANPSTPRYRKNSTMRWWRTWCW